MLNYELRGWDFFGVSLTSTISGGSGLGADGNRLVLGGEQEERALFRQLN
jgi:hypothetical protein